MKFRLWVIMGLCITTQSFASASKPIAEPPTASQPNVLVVLLDDFGTGQFAPLIKELNLDQVDPKFKAYTAELDEPYDQQVALDTAKRAMPFMDTLAEQGVLFSRAFTASSLCAPSRQGLLTGDNPIRWGAYRNIDINVCGLPKGRSLVERIHDTGYATAMIGKWHVGQRDHSIRDKILAAGGTDEDVKVSGYWGSVIERDHPLNHGFDYAFFYNLWECDFYDSTIIWENREFTGKQTEYNTDLFTRKAMEFMDQSMKADKPFFVELALHAVHIPLNVDAPEKYAKQFDTGYQAVDRFYSHLYGVDASVKRIVDMLKDRGEWENTILVVAGDNGATCKTGAGDLSLIPGNGTHQGHKGQQYLGGIRVPLMMVWPKGIEKPMHIKQAVSLMDVLPTVLDAAGAVQPEGIEGKSLLPILSTNSLSLHPQLFFAGIHAPAWGYSSKYTIGNAQDRRDLWHGGWAIVEGDYILRFIGTLDPGLEKEFPEGLPPYYGLFNLKTDPLEQKDLMKELPEVAERMKKSYMAYADELPPPHAWDRSKWAELVPHPEKHETSEEKPVVEPE